MARKSKAKKVNHGNEFVMAENKETKLIISVTAKNPGQKKALKAIAENQVTFVYGRPGTGKAQPLSSTIYTPTGPVSMGSISVGDIVCTPSGTANVIGVFPQGERDVYKVSFEDGNSTECCAEHLWTVYERDCRNSANNGQKTEELKSLMNRIKSRDNRANFSLPEISPVEFDARNLLIEPYLLGLLIGDGSIINSNIIFTNEDEELVSYAISTVDEKYEMKVCSKDIDYRLVRKESNRHNNHYKELLRYYGIWGKKSYDKFIPGDYLYSCYEDRLAILQGLMDTDGSVTKEGQAAFCTTSYNLAIQVKFLSESLGGVATIREKSPSYEYKGEKRLGHKAYLVLLGLKNDSIAFRLDRKKNKCKSRTKYMPKRRIKNIELIGKKECQCIMIDDRNHLYLTDGLIPTHNTHCAVGWGIQEMLKGNFQRVIFTRPYVEAGEKLGFLPGDSNHKFAPFVMPLYEVISDYLSQDDLKDLIDEKKIIVYPLAYMRGVTFKNSFVVADECQNSTVQQMRMMLTRIGEGSKIVCTGDVEQSDLGNRVNGLSDAICRLHGVPNLEFIELGYESCVREKIVSDIDQRYNESARQVFDVEKERELFKNRVTLASLAEKKEKE